ncbi:MAG: hypothetical protein HUJ29_05655 [Gammaproteobacteria bacterium]|nr:hypothetical protein [Gammaproteobacteria bacterium]
MSHTGREEKSLKGNLGFVVGMKRPVHTDNHCLEIILKSAAGQRERLGGMLIAAKRLTQTELDMALCEQECSGEKLGQILMRRGYLSMSELDAILSFQNKLGSELEGVSPLQLGKLLIACNDITEAQLHEALEIQKQSGQRIGDILVQAGYAKPSSIKKGLGLQKKLMSLAIATLLSTSAFLGGASDVQAGESSVSYAAVSPVEIYSAGLKQASSSRQLEKLYNKAINMLNKGASELERAKSMLKYAADSGYTQAQFTLGMVYLEDEYTEKTGLYWLERAAQNGHVDAEFAYNNYQNRDFGIGC